MRATFTALLFLLTAGLASADPVVAKKHNNAGMKLYAKGDYAGAQALFEKAIKEDPAFVKAHYNRASMAALQANLDVMIEEFVWLKGATDPDAERVLAKAKTDADFRGVSLIHDARLVLRLPPIADTPLDQLVLEYGGAWNGIDEGMMEGWLEVKFAPKGKVKGRDHSGETGQWYPWSGTWKADGKKVIVTVKKNKTVYELKECSEPIVEGQLCLMREDGGAHLSR